MIKILKYEDFVIGCQEIAISVDKKLIKNIYGIPRGGLVLAVYLSHLLNIPIVDRPTGKETLIVDDIADTGTTLNDFKDYTIATLYYHKQSKVKPDIWIYEKKDNWILFPWENE